MEKRKSNRQQLEETIDVDLRDDAYEAKHRQWLARRKFVSYLFAFALMALVIVISKDFFNRHDVSISSINSQVSSLTQNQGLRNTEFSTVKEVSQQKIIPEKVDEVLVPKDSTVSVIDQQARVEALIEEIRGLKRSGVVIETSDEAKAKVEQLQTLLRVLVPLKYGPEPYTVTMHLKFPESMPDYLSAGSEGEITFELGPLKLVPYSTYFFLDVIDHWKSGAFHRNAGHVLQAQMRSSETQFAFQEYHPDFPHKQYTLGYAGRPSSAYAFYISTVDNTQNHGPGSQGSATEADSCFGRIIPTEANIQTVKRMQKQPGKQKPAGFIDHPKNYIDIVSMKMQSGAK